MTETYVIVRYGGTPEKPWAALGSLMLDDLDAARAFAAKLDHARVFRLEPVDPE